MSNITKSLPYITIALIEPCIPQNTGNIGRLCVAINAHLVLVGDLGFSLSDKHVRRSGMDYWKDVQYSHITMDSFVSDFWGKGSIRSIDTDPSPSPYSASFLSTHATKPYTDIPISTTNLLVFGNEEYGLPSSWYNKVKSDNTAYRIPMTNLCRSLNLSSSAAILAYHLLGKSNFQGLS